jgi:hypothetical protein
MPTIDVFFTGNKYNVQDHTFSVLSCSHEQEHQGFILVQAPVTEVIALHPTVCYC